MHLNVGQDTVNGWLLSLGGSKDPLSLDQQGHSFLVADNEIGLMISCPEGSQQVAVFSQLIPLPIPLSTRLYEELLALNLSLEFTSGTYIFFDKKTRALGLAVSRDIASLNEINFRHLLTNFKQKAAEIKGFLDSLLYGDHITQTDTHYPSIPPAFESGFSHRQEGV
jgi:hypothetical protein